MGIFNFFKKKETERHFDPTNITVKDLGKGYIFEYKTENWTVNAVFEYDWGGNYFTREFTIQNGEIIKYLHLEDDGGLTVTLSDKIKIRKLGEEVTDFIYEKQKPPKKIIFEGIKYFLDEKAPGFTKEIDQETWAELVSYDYIDEDEENVLSIEQYSDESFEASVGQFITESSIYNILPNEEN
jgi:hypothetical protein